jgi:putative ABC transport system ATP-binding protein
VKLTDVSKTYRLGDVRVRALGGIDLTIDKGDFIALAGPSGSGKTTLLNLIGCIDKPDSGRIVIDSVDVTAVPLHRLASLRRDTLGFIFQTFNLIPTLTAAENAEAALIPLGISHANRRERVAQALDSVGLADRAQHLPAELSGGQQQRVAIARALVKEPNVLLADEPTGNLDEDTRDEIIALLDTVWRERGLTLILVTHDSAVARRAQRIGLMRNGRLTVRQDTRA